MMWVLDFDCCRRMEMDEDGVKRAARAFVRNDPYFPRTGRENPDDGALWDVFEERFLERSAEILEGEGEEVRRLPGVLIWEIKRIIEGRKGKAVERVEVGQGVEGGRVSD